MQRLQCPTCANEVFFDSLDCVRCRTALAVDAGRRDGLRVLDAATLEPCAHRATWGCNWPAAPGGGVCASCALVDAGDRTAERSMVTFQSAQRRALYQLTRLGVPWGDDEPTRLRFLYRSKSGDVAAVIGHRGGEITLDLDEAEPARREEIRVTLGELYRTPLGHIRHELGHYVWLALVSPRDRVRSEFRDVFGDERDDYAAALARHYGRLDDGSWRDRYVSFYASAHPWEDFAESWAQVMHVHDVVETGASWGVVTAPSDPADARAWLDTSIRASVAANELARSMGTHDLYPFTLSTGARAKIEFCWRLLSVPAP